MRPIGRRRLLVSSGAALATLRMPALAAPALAAGERERVLRFIPQVDLVSLDPHFSMTNVTRNHAGLVFDQLYGTDSKQQAQPQMVDGHVMEDGGRRWTLTLRQGLRFHDGEQVLARDCVASLRRWGRRDVLGAELLRISDEITATDDRTMVFRFKQPFSKLPQALGKPGAYMPAMMPERLAQTDPFKQIPEVIGSGPFRYLAAERLQGVRNVYARFDGYVPRPNGAPDRAAGPKIVHFERVVWTTMPDQGIALAALQTGEQDWWEYASQDLLPLIRRDPTLRGEVLETEGNMAFVRFNHLQPPFNRPEMRRVILRALNQEDFTAVLGGGNPEARAARHRVLPDRHAGRDAGWVGDTAAALQRHRSEGGAGGGRLRRREDRADLARRLPERKGRQRRAGRPADADRDQPRLHQHGLVLDDPAGDQQGPAGNQRLPHSRAERAVVVGGIAIGEFAAARHRVRGIGLVYQPAL